MVNNADKRENTKKNSKLVCREGTKRLQRNNEVDSENILREM